MPTLSDFFHKISESFSLWLKSPKRGAKSLPCALSTQRKDAQGTNLAPLFGDLSRNEKLSGIEAPLEPGALIELNF